MLIFLRYCTIALILIATLSDAGIIVVFARIKYLLDSGAWKLIMFGFILLLINSVNLIIIILGRPKRIIALILIMLYFTLSAFKQVIWFFGFRRFSKDLKFN